MRGARRPCAPPLEPRQQASRHDGPGGGEATLRNGRRGRSCPSPTPPAPHFQPPLPAPGSAGRWRSGRGGGSVAPQPMGERQLRRQPISAVQVEPGQRGAARAALRPGAPRAPLGLAAAVRPLPGAGTALRGPDRGSEEPLCAPSFRNREQDRAGGRAVAVSASWANSRSFLVTQEKATGFCQTKIWQCCVFLR